VFWLMDTSDAMFADIPATIDNIWTAVEAHLVPATDPQVQYVGIGFEDARTVPYGGITQAEGPATGTRSVFGNPLPSNSCKAVKKGTAALGRSGRGRWFFPTLSTGDQTTGDTLTSATLTAIITGLTGLQTSLESGLSPAQMGIVSFRHGGVAEDPGVFHQITSWTTINNDMDTQRRRLLGHNRHR
jgi:hypothetical protein